MFKYYKTVTSYNGSNVYTKQHDTELRRKPESVWGIRACHSVAALESPHVKDL